MSDTEHEPETAAAAEEIVSEARDIKQRIRDLILATFRRGKLELGRVSDIAGQVVAGATAAIARAAPDDPASTLRQVGDGIMEAFTITANAARLTLEEASAKGTAFAQADLKQTVADLKRHEEAFVETLSIAAGKSQKVIGEELSRMAEHAKRTGTSIAPVVKAALVAAAKHPIQLGTEAAATGVNVARSAVGALFRKMSDLIDPPERS